MEPEKFIYSYFKAKGYRSSENTMKTELKSILKSEVGQLNNWSICLSAMTELFKSIHDLNQDESYFNSFELLKTRVESSPEFYQNDLRKVMGPIFIYMYLEMLQRDMQESAEKFFEDYSSLHWNQNDLESLSKITDQNDDKGIFKEKYKISIQKYSFNQLIHFIETHNLAIILSIINKNLEIDLTLSPSETVLLGKELKILNSKSLLILEEEKSKKDIKIPLPSIVHLNESRNIESQNKAYLSESDMPNIICYTIRNANEALCIDVSENGAILACGFEDSTIRIFEIQETRDGIELIGHNGSVLSVSISPDLNLLISGSDDSCIRLWSLYSYSCLVVYRAHNFPIWTVKFSPFGHYFLSGSHDKIAYLWSTEWNKPLRMLIGHYSDILTASFHPKCSYVATGSTDKSVRIWDINTGECSRIFIGHAHSVNCCIFSRDGRKIISCDDIGDIICWDINKKDKVWHLQLSGGIISIGICYNDQFILAGNNKKEVYAITTNGKIIAGYKTKVEVVSTGFSSRNLGIVCGITRIYN